MLSRIYPPWKTYGGHILGTTDLPLDVVREYLESLKQIYTAEVSSIEPSKSTCAKLTSILAVI
jgi:predicted transcriptional regulator